MKDIAVKDMRNFVLLGHTGSGKTTLGDALLFKLGLNDRMGSVSAGTSAIDFNEEEISRKISVYAKPFCGVFKRKSGGKMQLSFIDTPGYDDFIGQVIPALRVSDLALLVVDALSGIQVGSHRAWRMAAAADKPRAIVITGGDRENADFGKALEQVQSSWGPKCLPATLPLPGNGGVWNVMDDKEVPAPLAGAVQKARSEMIERAAETDDALLEKYLGGESLAPDEIARGLKAAVRTGNLVPVFAAMPLKDIGIAELIDGMAGFFPSPDEVPFKDREGNAVNPAPDAPAALWIWRTLNDPFSGKVSFARVLSGRITPDTEAVNLRTGQKERIAAFMVPAGKKPSAGSEAGAGDVVALVKLKNSSFGDLLVAGNAKIEFEPFAFPDQVVSFAVFAKDRGDEDKIGGAMARIAEDDPMLRIERNADTHETVISGMGDTHIDVAMELLRKRSNVQVELKTPKVPYKETVTAVGEGHYKHKKQSGGRGQYAEVYCRVQPLKPGEEWFEDAVVGGVIPKNFLPACQKGFLDSMAKGALASCPVVNVKVSVYDGSYHDVDSSEIAFKIAAGRAFKDAMTKARAVLLEPIMNVRVLIPNQHVGDINSDLNHKRGRIMGVDVEDGMQAITAEVPLSEMFRYCSELRSITGGRGTFEMKFLRYDNVPSNVAQKIIAAAEKDKEVDED
ncbi:MAG: elongation factor G [Lentisphaerae bacterium]|nr:elongation factor G [Lentisphaerota bacterium]